ncbi:MAG: preprotein translocase subunit SecE [Desulfatiglandaceae bacterium]
MKKPAKKGKKKKNIKKKNAAPPKSTQSTRVDEETPPQPKAKQVNDIPARTVQKTVQKKASETRGKEAGFASRAVKKTSLFLREAKTELRKVKWPTRKELLASTAVVIVLTLFVALYLGLVDFGLIKIIKIIVN